MVHVWCIVRCMYGACMVHFDDFVWCKSFAVYYFFILLLLVVIIQHHCRLRPIQLYIKDESPTTMEQCSTILQSAHSPKSFDMTKQGCVRKQTGSPQPLITKAAYALTPINLSHSNISRRSNNKLYKHIKQSNILPSYLL